MSGADFMKLTVWEVRRSLRLMSTRITLMALLAAGLLSIELGQRFWQSQQQEIADLTSQHEAQMKRLSHRYVKGGEAGYWAYSSALPTWQEPHPLATLTWGVRDVTPMVTWVRLLGLEPQLYDAPLGNPKLQALGGFDLAFVLALLAPCALLLLAHDALSRDASRGTLPLIAVQAGGLMLVLAARVLSALLLVLGACVVLGFAAVLWPGSAIRLDLDTLEWFGSVGLHLLFWAVVVAAVASYCRTPAASLAASFGVWVWIVVLLPALINLVISAWFPVPQGLELTVRQRQAMHRAWDEPRQANFDRFLKSQPDWSHPRRVSEDFSWTWYYAMHDLADQSVSDLAESYVTRLRERRLWTERLSWLSPPVRLQLRLSATARTDLESHFLHMTRVRAFHEKMKQHFFPLITAEKTLLPADIVTFPKFTDTAPPASQAPASTPLLILPLALLLLIRPQRLLAS